MPLDGTLIYF